MSPHTILIQACCWVIQMNINTSYIRERIGFDINTFSQFMLQMVEGDHRTTLSMKLALRMCCIHQVIAENCRLWKSTIADSFSLLLNETMDSHLPSHSRNKESSSYLRKQNVLSSGASLKELPLAKSGTIWAPKYIMIVKDYNPLSKKENRESILIT